MFCVPDRPVLRCVEGDGPGPGLWSTAVRESGAAVERTRGGRRRIEWIDVLAGEKSNLVCGPGTVTCDRARPMREEGRAGVREMRCSEFTTEIIGNFNRA